MSEQPVKLRSFAHSDPAGAPTPPGPAPEEHSDAGFSPRRGAALMARPRTGEIRRTVTGQGIFYSLRFFHRGERHTVRLGGDWEGWDTARVEQERTFLMEKLARGEWAPAAPDPEPAPSAAPCFQLEASEWLQRQAVKAGDPERRSKTVRDLEWRLSVVMDAFGPVAIDRLGYRHAEDLVTALADERLSIARAAERGEPLTRAYTDPRTGRTHERRRRGVANSSIRRALDTAERVLRDAKRRGALAGELPELRAAAPKPERPRRSYLEPEQIVAVLRAAELLEAEHRGLTWAAVAAIRASGASARALAREFGVSDTLIGKVRRGELWTAETPAPRNRNDVPRRPIVQTLILTGLRVSELCGLCCEHVDLASGRVHVPRAATKTDAGERVLPLLPVLRERLAEHRLGPRAGPAGPGVPDARRHRAAARQRACAHHRPGPPARQRAARRRRPPADRAHDAAHAAAHVRLAARGLRRAAAARHVPDGPHGRQLHHVRLPAGARRRVGLDGGARAGPRRRAGARARRPLRHRGGRGSPP